MGFWEKHWITVRKPYIATSFWNPTFIELFFDLSSTIFSGHHQAATGGIEEHWRGRKSLYVFHWLAQYDSEKLHGVNGYRWTSGPSRHGEEDEKTRGIDPFAKNIHCIYFWLSFTVAVLNLQFLSEVFDAVFHTCSWTGCNKSAQMPVIIVSW